MRPPKKPNHSKHFQTQLRILSADRSEAENAQSGALVFVIAGVLGGLVSPLGALDH